MLNHTVRRGAVAADFHIHVRYSRDSLLKPRDLVKIASQKGIEVLAVTDHNTLRGGFETIEEARRIHSEIIVIPGMEISTNLGHIIGVFIQENISARNYADALDQIKRQNGLVIIPHPCNKSQKIGENEIAKADLFEAINGRATRKENELALSFGRSLSKPLVAGSDAHFPFEIGRVRTILPWKPNNHDELKKMLQNGSISSIETTVDSMSPYVSHLLSFSLETYRRFMRVRK
jgi:predicted metal-dependent phosphoesterase TrpH